MENKFTSSRGIKIGSDNDPELLNQNTTKLNSLDAKKRKELEASLGWLFLTDNIKKRTREKIQQNMKNNDKFAVLFALIGVCTNIIASSYYITFDQSAGIEL